MGDAGTDRRAARAQAEAPHRLAPAIRAWRRVTHAAPGVERFVVTDDDGYRIEVTLAVIPPHGDE